MSEPQPSNEELTFAAGLFTVFLCILFGSNAVAIKISFSGLGVFTTAAIRFDFRNRVLSGQEEERPRWKRGITMVNQMVGEALGKLYVAAYFPPEAKFGKPAFQDVLREVSRLYRETSLPERRIFAMVGHRDGVVSFGRDADEAGVTLLTALARAYEGTCAR